MTHALDSAFGTASVSSLTRRCLTCGIPVDEGVDYCDEICDKLQLTEEMIRREATRRNGVNWYIKKEYDRISL